MQAWCSAPSGGPPGCSSHGRYPPANAFADRTAGAGEVKAAMPVRHRKAEAVAVRVGRAHVDLPASFVLNEEMMEEDAPADRVTILLHALERNLDLFSIGGDIECRTHQVGAAQRAAGRGGQHEFRTRGRQRLLGRGGGRRGDCQHRRQSDTESKRRDTTLEHRLAPLKRTARMAQVEGFAGGQGHRGDNPLVGLDGMQRDAR